MSTERRFLEKLKKHVNNNNDINDVIIAGDCNQSAIENEIKNSMMK